MSAQVPRPFSAVDLPALTAALKEGPKSTRELIDEGLFVGNPTEGLKLARALEADGVICVDPDMFPDELVPGNPLVLRLPGDDRQWPGWKRWNL